ncbi:MAG TPA: DUF6445 family protein, partial [bacterium]|nr:DUF6445 family protein [bacterium]
MSELSLKVVENFLPNFYAEREHCLGLEFGEQKYQHETYKNISSDWGRYPIHLLEDVMGFPCQNVLSFYRFTTEDSDSRIDVHSDLSTGADYASVLYMSTPEQDLKNFSGTALFRHIPTGLRSINHTSVMKSLGYTDDIISSIANDEHDESKWKMEGFVSMKSNRLVVYPASIFHSKYPGKSFGKDKETGRLIWVNFFKG